MKKSLIFVFLLFTLCLFAREADPNSGIPVFKIKPEYRSNLSLSTARTNLFSLDTKLQSLQIKAIKPYFSTNPAKSANHDISLVFKVDCDANPRAIVNLLSRDPHVEYAELIYPDEILAVPDDPLYPTSEYFTALEAEAAWDIHKGEDGINPVIIAIVDTGTRWFHPDLGANIWNNLGEDANGNGYTLFYNGTAWVMDPGDINGIDDDGNGRIDDLIGWNFMLNAEGDEDNNPSDPNGHGTRVSGIACAVTNNAVGVSSLSWNLTLMPISCSHGPSSVYKGYEAIIYAAENGADIINCSWGGTGYSQTNQIAVNYAHSLGSIVVAAAGNGNNSTPLYPAGYQNVLATAAVQNTGVKSSVSSYGAYVDVAAPNTNVGTTYISGGYAWVSDFTSYASPIASALAGLIKSYLPAITQDQLINRIKGSCDDVDAVNPGKENMLGEGKLNARRALAEADPMPDNEVKLFLLQNRGATDANNNRAVEPGELFSVNLTLRSYGHLSANGNFLLSTTNPAVSIISNSHTQTIPADDYLYLDSVFSIQALPTATSQYVNFTLSISADYPVVLGATINFSILIHAGGIFVWEGVAGARNMSGAYIRTTLQGMGYTCVYGTTFPSSFYSFEAVFLSFGAVDTNVKRFNDQFMYLALREYLQSGGRVYIEGADVIGFDMATYLPDVEGELDAHEILWPLLGVATGEDGATNAIDNLAGVSNTPSAGLLFTSSAQTNVTYIDTYSPILTYARSFFNESDYGCVGVVSAGAYDQRSIVFSYALRELNDGVFPHTRANLIARIMEFFEAEEVTLPLELTSFTAAFSVSPILQWSTASETSLLGYNLYRSETRQLSAAQKVNPFIIAATGGSSGANYRYTDEWIADSDTLFYWLESVSYSGSEQFFGPVTLALPQSGEPELPPIPETALLTLHSYPNPFGQSVSFQLELGAKTSVQIAIYNLKGQLIKSYPGANYETGTHYVNWDGKDETGRQTATGIYLMRVSSPNQTLRRKIVRM